MKMTLSFLRCSLFPVFLLTVATVGMYACLFSVYQQLVPSSPMGACALREYHLGRKTQFRGIVQDLLRLFWESSYSPNCNFHPAIPIFIVNIFDRPSQPIIFFDDFLSIGIQIGAAISSAIALWIFGFICYFCKDPENLAYIGLLVWAYVWSENGPISSYGQRKKADIKIIAGKFRIALCRFTQRRRKNQSKYLCLWLLHIFQGNVKVTK
mmetsp:Transcript_16605/g.33487  ORF Transcript_16605/g.33487 Transcript_16605/m.33487 type:complete len:210 (-) Transcript_16605:524-1153(-)